MVTDNKKLDVVNFDRDLNTNGGLVMDWMRRLCIGIIASLSLAACGGGGSDEDEQNVEITAASRCAFKTELIINDISLVTPDNCMREEISGSGYVTDQKVIHLSGISPPEENDGCPDPALSLSPPLCLKDLYRPFDYSISWVNSSNGASGIGRARYNYAYGLRPPLGDKNVIWTTYESSNKTFNKGIPLEPGSNLIRVTTKNSGLKGNAEITVTRVVDVTPPTVQSVEGLGLVYFSEHLDPASLTSAISVIDDNAQSVAGTSEYDPLELIVRWQPLSPLNPGTSYTAQISGVTDWAPNVMIDPFVWAFTTRP